jgi:hypothetical protein
MATRPKRRWFQYSLCTLLVLVTVASLPCSWLAVKIRQKETERQAVEAIKKMGGIVLYDYQIRELGDAREIVAPGPAWVLKLLGDDSFSDAAFVVLENKRTGIIKFVPWQRAS